MPLADSRISLPARYRVVRHIANGGMASVWAAEDEILGRLVAVKVLAQHVAADPGMRTRFEREARTAARVSDHPHVVTIYDVGEHEDVPFIVMELFAGGTVADRLRQAGGDGPAVPREQALTWLEQAAGALDHAHAAGIVHRDVKPANLLLDERDRLAVGDFGIARAADDASLTQAGQVLGTAAYLSPEQALGEQATAASDRYALGVVAYELLTGRRPFRAEHVSAQARMHVEGEVPDSGLGPDVDDVLRRALAKDPDARYPTAARFVEELRAVAGRAPRPAAAPSPTAPTRVQRAAAAPRRPAAAPPRPVAAPPRRGGPGAGVWALAALAVVAVAVAIAVLLAGGGEEERPRSERPQATQPAEREQPPATQAEEEPAEPEPEPQAEEPPAQEAPPPAEDAEPESGPGPDDAAESPEALNAQGYEALQNGDAEQAIALLEAADRGFQAQGDAADPLQWGYALFNLGQAYMQAGRPEDAVAAYERRLQVSPNDQRGTVMSALNEARQAARGRGRGGEGGGH